MAKVIKGDNQVALVISNKQAEKLTDLLGWTVDRGPDGLVHLLDELRKAGYLMPDQSTSNWKLSERSITYKKERSN